MASSGDYSFNPNTYSIITGALRLIGAIQTAETPPAEEYEDAMAALNGLITHFQATGIHVWSEEEVTLFLQPGAGYYEIGYGSPDHCCLSNAWGQTTLPFGAAAGATSITVADASFITGGNHVGTIRDSGALFWTQASANPTGNVVPLAQGLPGAAAPGSIVVSYAQPMVRPLRVPAARRYRLSPDGHGIETPMGVMARLDYANIPNKQNQGVPTAFFFDPELGRAIMKIWPTPSTSLEAVKFTAQRPLQNFTTQRDTADIPVEWISCLRFNLAVELAPEYDVPAERFQVISAMAQQKYAVCSTWDREPQSVYFGLESFPAVRD